MSNARVDVALLSEAIDHLMAAAHILQRHVGTCCNSGPGVFEIMVGGVWILMRHHKPLEIINDEGGSKDVPLNKVDLTAALYEALRGGVSVAMGGIVVMQHPTITEDDPFRINLHDFTIYPNDGACDAYHIQGILLARDDLLAANAKLLQFTRNYYSNQPSRPSQRSARPNSRVGRAPVANAHPRANKRQRTNGGRRVVGASKQIQT